MRGVLRVIPSPGVRVPQRVALLTGTPTLAMLERAVGGEPELVPDFDSVLYAGEIVGCQVFCRKGAKEEKFPTNSFASLLALQCQIRKEDFTLASALAGPVAIVHGDPEFMDVLHDDSCSNIPRR